jgi:hypothetical protein
MSSDSARRKARQATNAAIVFRTAFDRLRMGKLRRKALVQSGSNPLLSLIVALMVISLASICERQTVCQMDMAGSPV